MEEVGAFEFSFLFSWYTKYSLVWSRRRLQRDGYGLAWTQFGGHLQFLQEEIHNQNDFDDCRPDDLEIGVFAQ